MAKWGEIKCPRCAELKDKLNYAVGEREDYEKIIKQLQAEWLANRVEIMRLEAKLAQQDDLVQAAVAAALREAVEAVRSQHGDPDNENGIALAEAAILALITPDEQAALDRVVSARFGVVRSEVVRLSAEGKIDSEATERLLAAIRKGGE